MTHLRENIRYAEEQLEFFTKLDSSAMPRASRLRRAQSINYYTEMLGHLRRMEETYTEIIARLDASRSPPKKGKG